MTENALTKPKRGCFARLISAFLFLVAVAFAWAFYLATQPQDLSDIGGYGREDSTQARDLHEVLKQSLKGHFSVSLTESEINDWISTTLEARQTGPLASKITLKRVWVRLHEDMAEVIMVREAFGHDFTTSVFLKLENVETDKGRSMNISYDGGPYVPGLSEPPCGGRFGRLRVPQGFLILVLPAFEKLAAAFHPEIDLIRDMARSKIEKNHLILDPNEPLPKDGLF